MAQQPPVNKYLDLIKNREALVGAQIPAVIAAVILGQIDQAIHFTDQDPLTSTLLVYVVANVVAIAWARLQVWSRNSVGVVAGEAYAQGVKDVTPEDPQA